LHLWICMHIMRTLCVESVRRTGFQIAVQLAYKTNYLLQTSSEIKSFH
jgi:hypothetical protein